jgi:hypothetical protein
MITCQTKEYKIARNNLRLGKQHTHVKWVLQSITLFEYSIKTFSTMG